MKKNQHLTLGGLFIALHLLFLFLSKVFAGSELILVIFLPLLSTIYALKFDKKATIMFFVATFLLCLIFEPISSLIYVLPSLICGSVYGILRKKEVKELSLVYISSLSHSFCLLITFSLIAMLFKEVNFFSIFAMFIKKEGTEFYICVYLILVLLGVLEAFLTHIITNSELKRLGYNEAKKEETTPLWINIALGISLVSYVVLACINPSYSCYIFPFLLAFSIPNVIEFISNGKKKWIYFIVGILTVVSIFLMRYLDACLYPALILVISSPLILENFVRVLYTNSIKYSNNGENRIE